MGFFAFGAGSQPFPLALAGLLIACGGDEPALRFELLEWSW